MCVRGVEIDFRVLILSQGEIVSEGFDCISRFRFNLRVRMFLRVLIISQVLILSQGFDSVSQEYLNGELIIYYLFAQPKFTVNDFCLHFMPLFLKWAILTPLDHLEDPERAVIECGIAVWLSVNKNQITNAVKKKVDFYLRRNFPI